MKTNLLKTFFAALLLLCSSVASAHDFEADGIFYNITDATAKTVEVTYKGDPYSEYNEYSGSVIIPSTVSYNNIVYSITTIGDFAFYGCRSLTSVEIPSSVTSIGFGAFIRCSGLTSIEIPNSVTSIGNNAFWECSGLTSVEIPNSVTSIGNNAFWECSGLTSIEIPNSVTSIGNNAFYDCDGLTSIVIPNSVTTIGVGAFSGCYRLASIEIPNSVTTIGDCAFDGCSRLTSVVIPNSVTTIGVGAFSDCYRLASIVVDDGNSVYDSREGCNAIIETASNTLIAGCENTIIPNSVTTIGVGAFSGCYRLASIEIPNSVTTIGGEAFYGCSGLTSIVIPNSVTTIGEEAFYGCSGLTSVVIPNSVTTIGYRTFYYCNGLTSIEIPNSVTTIGYRAFSNCDGLTNVTIPNSVTSIGDHAFNHCRSLTNVTIPDNVKSIGHSAFQYCDLPGIHIPASVESIGDYAFTWNLNLSSITVDKDNPVYYVPEGYKNIIMERATNKIVFACGGAAIPQTATAIGAGAFNGVGGIESVTIHANITSIGDWAFDGCRDLKTIYALSETPLEISSNVFLNASSAATLYVPHGTKEAYEAAEGWKNFTNIVEMPADALPGDVNEDGRVSVADITTVVDAILNESSDAAYDVNGDNRVSVADITTIVDIILNEGASAASKAPARVATRSTSALSLYIDPFEINAGEEKDILVNLSNPGTEITAVEFDLFLPEGLEVVSDEYGYYISHGSRTPNKRNPHTVSGALLSSGAIHVICYHNSQLAFTGEDGDVVVITIKAADDLEPGNYTIDLKNIELVNPADPTNGIFISDSNTVATDIENIEAEEEGTTEIYDLSGRRVNNLVKGIYIVNGKKVVK